MVGIWKSGTSPLLRVRFSGKGFGSAAGHFKAFTIALNNMFVIAVQGEQSQTDRRYETYCERGLLSQNGYMENVFVQTSKRKGFEK
jgi:hypothetical protein